MYWSDSHKAEFLNKLKDIQDKLDAYEVKNSLGETETKMTLKTSDGQEKSVVFDRSNLSSLSQTNRKWYAIVMRVSRRKFGFDSDEVIVVVNLKLPTEMFGSFGAPDGVYPAYHMNKLHWISVLLPDAPEDIVQFLVNVSFEATKDKRKRKKIIE